MTPAPVRLEFAGSQSIQLAGRLEMPDGPVSAYALFAHCFTCGKDAVAATRISRALTREGIAVLRFDFTGLGQSGGDFANTNFTSNIDDLVHAANFLRDEYRAPSILIGHSLGGAAVLAARSRIPEVRAVATVAAPADPKHITNLIGDRIEAVEAEGSAEVSLGGRPFRIRKQFLADLDVQHQSSKIENLDAALLVMHSPVDDTVGIENARAIFDTARHPKSFVALDGANHLLTNPRDAQFTASMIAAWVSPLVDRPTDANVPAASAARDLEPGVVRVSENGTGTCGQTIQTSQHGIFADEPHPIGEDSGMNPYDLLLGGLGACTSMTLRMYAQRKKWPLEKVEVTLRHARVHADDCAECETKPVSGERIERDIKITGNLTEEQRASLLAIADKCPVHRTLHANADVVTTLVSV